MEFFNEIIQEADFVPIADHASANLLNFAAHFARHPDIRLNRRFYVAIIRDSMELEDFLDDHGARNNRIWIYFGEIVASIRNFAGIGYMIRHILGRIKTYSLGNRHITPFTTDAQAMLDTINAILFRLFENLIHEAKQLGLHIPAPSVDEAAFAETIVVQMLPQNINDEDTPDIPEKVVRIANAFKHTHEESEDVAFPRKLPLEKICIHTLIPERINEETLRRLETLVHNAQSMYDTYIRKTPLEAENDILNSLRGHISVTLHLLGVAKALCHFYERHETIIRNEHTRQRIARIVPDESLSDSIINFALHYYTLFINDGVKTAQEIIEQFSVTTRTTVPVPRGLGFHLRPSTLVAKLANHYGGHLTMHVQENEFDASSVIDIMWAAGIIKKEGIAEITFSGDQNAVRDIQLLAGANYGEDTGGNSVDLPGELAYLRQE